MDIVAAELWTYLFARHGEQSRSSRSHHIGAPKYGMQTCDVCYYEDILQRAGYSFLFLVLKEWKVAATTKSKIPISVRLIFAKSTLLQNCGIADVTRALPIIHGSRRRCMPDS
jgi:hypothetical protein